VDFLFYATVYNNKRLYLTFNKAFSFILYTLPIMTLFDNYEVKDLNNLEILAKQVVEGFIIGLHKSPFHGFSVEFAEHRIYNQGENTKNIDWKVYGRTDKMFSKRYEEETNLRCQILLDVSSSMYFPDATKPHQNKLGFSALAAASLMNLLMKQRDAFGLSIFDTEVREHTKAKASTTQYRYLLGILDKYLAEKQNLNKKTSATEAIHQIADSIHKRSLVCIFSDMFEDNDESENLFSALQHLKYNKHEVVLFHVVDKSKELDFAFDNRPTIFVDMESGEKVRLQPNQIKEFYIEQVSKFTEKLKERCLQFKIDLVECDVNKGFKDILQTYLVKRTKMQI
jgi:uncharacterized protein (DUF58 family)